jgi:hypothetical protein
MSNIDVFKEELKIQGFEMMSISKRELTPVSYRNLINHHQ